MLRDIITGRLQSRFIVIEDTLEQSGVELLQALIYNLVKAGHTNLHVLCFENPVENLKNCDSSFVQYHDYFNDRDWYTDYKKEVGDLEFYSKTTLLDCVEKSVPRIIGEYSVIIDSLSCVIFNEGFAQCYRDLHTILFKSVVPGSRLSQLISIVHEDLLPDPCTTILRLKHLVTSYLQVLPPPPTDLSKPLVSITHRKQGGTILKKVQQFIVDDENNVVCFDMKSARPARVEEDPIKAIEEMTTFKLSLGEHEKQARSQLVLPYVRMGPQSSREEKKGGQVFYQPDAADDWDEEDPDNDLEI